MLALIDGDIAAYRAACVTQKSLDWGDGEGPAIYVDPADAARAAIETIGLWVAMTGAKKALVCLTGIGNFRKAVYPLYKSNRSGVARPVALEAVRDAIRREFPTATVDGLEADDLLGLALSDPRAAGRSVCVSMDKDLRTVPGLHLNPAKDRQPVLVLEAEANRYWLTQALTGDASDGYPGCKNVGPVKARKLLEPWDGADPVEGFGIVASTFAARGHGEDDALQSVRVARILRAGDYDKSRKEVVLWHPTTPGRLGL